MICTYRITTKTYLAVKDTYVYNKLKGVGKGGVWGG